MELGYHIILVGIIYLIAGILFYPRSRNNLFDKGYAWVLFASFHGIDEIVDGVKLLNILPEYALWLEKIELTTFFLSSSFLLIATLIKIDRIRSDELLSIGILVQIPVILFFITASEDTIETIDHSIVIILGYEVKFFTLIFGLLPTIPLIVLYFYEFVMLLRQRSQARVTKTYASLILISLMMIIYNIGELFGTNPGLLFLLYGEVMAIVVILIIPIEFNIASNQKLQLHLVYHRDGFPLVITKFNTNLGDDVLVLVTGFLTAVNSLVEHELDLGALEHIETGNGHLYIKHNGDLIHAALASAEDTLIQEKLHGLTNEIADYVETNKIEEFAYIENTHHQQLKNLVYRKFS